MFDLPELVKLWAGSSTAKYFHELLLCFETAFHKSKSLIRGILRNSLVNRGLLRRNNFISSRFVPIIIGTFELNPLSKEPIIPSSLNTFPSGNGLNMCKPRSGAILLGLAQGSLHQ